MFQRADRYTVLTVDPRDFAAHVEAARKLGLCWFAEDAGGQCKLYLFFDEAGRQNYLSTQYGSVVDEIRSIVETATPETPAADLLQQVAERIGL